ncbi:MAG TPA: heparan-alpha-glucosaminide N-acetyltransferase domain-containing protein, partial [Phenylobacterium sp.]
MSAPDNERAEVLDALRGLALLGILVSHIPDFTGYGYLSPARQARLDPLGIDPSVAAALVVFIRGKFLALFALLFGISFAVQLDSAARQGAPFRRRFGRRLAALFVIGAAHAAIWYGDILKDYAILG